MKKILSAISIILCMSLIFCSCSFDKQEEPNAPENPNEPLPKELYYFALINSDYLVPDDNKAISQIVSSYVNHDVFVLDVKDCGNAFEVYELLQKESLTKSGKLDGIQIFGTSDMVPAFLLDGKVKLPDSFTTYNSFFTDYFYSNFDNKVEYLQNFNVADSFSSGNKVSFTPSWRVVRLPLGSSEFSDYAENYQNYLTEHKAVKPDLVSFSSSIFRWYQVASGDDFAYFLDRAKNEWKLMDSVRLYATQEGKYLTPVEVLGDINVENLEAENKKGVAEFFISGTGSQNRIMNTHFNEEDVLKQTLFFTASQISNILDNNPYFLNLYSSRAAEGLDFNIVRNALMSGCLGAFAFTSSTDNNGLSCRASIEEMENSNNQFYFFYLYLKGLKDGLPRSEAFFEAQKGFESTLYACSQKEIDYGSNYQFGYNRLISYSNLGILEPETDILPEAGEYDKTVKVPPYSVEYVIVTNGREVGEEVTLRATLWGESNSPATIKKVKAVNLDNGYIRFKITIDNKKDTILAIWSAEVPLLTNECIIWIDIQRNLIIDEKAVPLEFVHSGANANFGEWEGYSVYYLTDIPASLLEYK